MDLHERRPNSAASSSTYGGNQAVKELPSNNSSPCHGGPNPPQEEWNDTKVGNHALAHKRRITGAPCKQGDVAQCTRHNTQAIQ